jgi:hypothetical protein
LRHKTNKNDMKKFNLRIAALAVSGVLAITSCKKENNSNNGPGPEVGNWTLTQVGEDENGNNKLDEGEVYTASEANIAMTINLKGDKTFTSSVTTAMGSANVNGTYTFANNALTTVANGETEVYPVTSLAADKMVIKDGPEADAAWLILKK